MSSSILRLEEFSLSISNKVILKNVDLNLNDNQIIAIEGSSGCGKTTLLRALVGLKKYKGKYYINNVDFNSLDRENKIKLISIVFQNINNRIFCATVEDEIAFALENLCMSKEEINNTINKVLDIVNMSEYRYHNPRDLSGGYQKLLYIAVVLAIKPKIYLFDEVFSELDKEKRQLVKSIINDISKDNLVILVDHFEENLKMAHKRYVLKNNKLSLVMGD